MLVAIIICELVGMIGAIFTMPAIPTWYAGIVKPTFTPPTISSTACLGAASEGTSDPRSRFGFSA